MSANLPMASYQSRKISHSVTIWRLQQSRKNIQRKGGLSQEGIATFYGDDNFQGMASKEKME